MNKNKIHLLLLAVVTVFFIWSFIKPKHYVIWMLEVAPSILAIVIILLLYNKMRLTTFSYTIIAFLTIMTFIGGHFTYDDVPLFDWIKSHFDLKRNDYDRFGHFLKGLLVIVFREILIRKTPLPIGKWLQFLALNMTLATAALYEIVEWIAGSMSKRTSKDFVGAQGDIWDAQWDMSLTLAGSLIAIFLLTKWHNRSLEKSKNRSPYDWS
jgi:putative membrane protein